MLQQKKKNLNYLLFTGQAIPAGLHVRINLATGTKEAKLLDEDEKPTQTEEQGKVLQCRATLFVVVFFHSKQHYVTLYSCYFTFPFLVYQNQYYLYNS